MASKKNKPTKHTNKFTPLTRKKSTERKTTKSRLLRLPSEIRNKIYGYVLCSERIHIVDLDVNSKGVKTQLRGRSHHTVLWNSLCNKSKEKNRLDDCDCYDDIRVGYGVGRRFDYDRVGHINFGLLRTCRQIYEEAGLMPYALNAFLFSSNELFCRFVSALQSNQQHAIRTVILSSNRSVRIEHPSLISLLTNLTECAIHVDCCNILRDDAIIPERRLKRLERLPLTRVRISFLERWWATDDEVGAQLATEARNVERRLLGAGEGWEWKDGTNTEKSLAEEKEDA